MNDLERFNRAQQAFEQEYGVSAYNAGFRYGESHGDTEILGKSFADIDAYLAAQKWMLGIGVSFNFWCIVLAAVFIGLFYDLLTPTMPPWIKWLTLGFSATIAVINIVAIIKVIKFKNIYDGKIYLHKFS